MSNPYRKYSGMAFEMVAYLLIGYFLGSWLDKWIETEKQYFTALFIILMMGAYLFRLYKDLIE